ncbi:hypothetical protein COK91_16215 [Bacillus cereus]|nr:hypothetical protein COK91_16215 [Bacillus cereus]
MNKLLLWCLLVTFCLNTAGCSNDMTILKDSSKPSTPTKVKCINKAWYKKYIPFDTPRLKPQVLYLTV